MSFETLWPAEVTRGAFLLAGAAIAFFGVLFSQRQQTRRDRETDARALRNSKRERLESTYLPILLSARAMWELVLRHGKTPEQVKAVAERDHLTRLWQRATEDVEESLVRMTMESHFPTVTAVDVFEALRSEFYLYLEYLSDEQNIDTGKNDNRLLATRESVYSNLKALEAITRQQQVRLTQPIPAKGPRRKKPWNSAWRRVRLLWRLPIRRLRNWKRRR